ncbi:MAG: AAA family ATPase, partial [Desulfosarcinaceae bacterium]
MRYGILDNRGFLLLTGEVGTGKTILINKLVSMLEIDTVVATLPDPDLESMDFYNLLADGFQMKRTFNSKAAFLIRLRDFLHQSHANHKQVLLIIDESQRLNHRLMEDIRVLSNIELHDTKLINIFFVGQQEFNSILLTPQNRALAQRITVRYHIEPLSLNETGEYVEHRLRVAGNKRKLFKSSAISEVYSFSNGIPRLINIICDHALLTAYAKGLNQVDVKIIQECAEELRIPFKYSENESREPAGKTKTQNPTTIANASRKAEAGVGKTENSATEKVSPESDSHPEQTAPRPRAWSLAHVAMILALLTIVAFAVTHFTKQEQPRWNADDLTPQKYKNTLENEKALLADKLKEGEGADVPPVVDAQPEKARPSVDGDPPKQDSNSGKATAAGHPDQPQGNEQSPIAD